MTKADALYRTKNRKVALVSIATAVILGLLLVFFGNIAKGAPATLVYLTGWEHGVTPVSTGGGLTNNVVQPGGTTLETQSTVKRTGNYALHIVGATATDVHIRGSLSGSSAFVISAYIYMESLPTSGNAALIGIEAQAGDPAIIGLEVDSTGLLKVDDLISATTQSGPTITTGTWHRIDLRIDSSASTWHVDWQVNGSAQTQFNVSVGASYNDVWWLYNLVAQDSGSVVGTSGSGATGAYFDDMVVSLTSGDYPIGERKVYGFTVDQAAPAEHQSISTFQWEYSDDGSTWNDFTGNSEVNSGSRIDDLSPSGAIRMNVAGDVTGNARWPIAYVPSESPSTIPTWVGAGTVTGSSGALTPTMPSGIKAEDILLLVVTTYTFQTATLSTSNGFTQVANSPQDKNIADGVRTTVFWKRATGSDSAPTIADSGDHQVAVIGLIRGAKTTGVPWNTSSGGGPEDGSDTSLSIPGSTTPRDNSLIAGIVSSSTYQSGGLYSSWSNADLANLTERVDDGVNKTTMGTSWSGQIGIVTGEKASAGAYGATTATLSFNHYKAYITLAFEGEADTPPTTDPDAVAALISVREGTTGTNDATFRTYLNGSTTNIFSGDPSWGSTTNYLINVMATDPGGGAWSNQDVEDLKLEADSTDASPNPWLNGAFYEVAYPVNSSPDAPTLSSPADGAHPVPTTPDLEMSAADPESDDVKYKVLIYDSASQSGGSCSGSLLETGDQTSTGTGWNNGTTAYSSGATATYTIQTTLTRGNSYCWQAQAEDIGGSNAFGSLSTPSTFTINSNPSVPTLVSPSSGQTTAPTRPLFQLRSTDNDSDYIQYFIQLYDATACGGSQVGSDIDQTVSQTNWVNQDAVSTTAYNGSPTLSLSSMGQYQYAGTPLTAGHLYSWRAKAIDPAGVNTFSSLSSCQDFTIASSDVQIQGGTEIRGGTVIQNQ